METRASFHAPSCRQLFTTDKSENLGIVKIRNGNKSRVVSMRNVHVVTSLDHKLILKNERHFTSLKANLLSLSKLDEIGYSS